jgi:hypothetical protein
MARNDIHAPSRIIPEDYEFVAYDYYGPDAGFMNLSGERQAFRAHMARTGGKFSGHDHAGSCHVCGAGAMHVAKFYHKLSNAYIVTGESCASKMHMGNPAAFRRFRDKVKGEHEAIAGKRKAKEILVAAGLAEAWELYEANVAKRKAHAEAYKEWQNAGSDEDSAPSYPQSSRDEDTVLEMIGKLIKYGSLSEKQLNFMGVLLKRIAKAPEIAAARAAELEAAKPVPVVEGRVEVKAKVLSIKQPEDYDQFPSVKMLIQHADGWKLWGRVPAAVVDEIERGDEIEFVARIQVSDKDPKFGFINRPSRARLIKAAAVAA